MRHKQVESAEGILPDRGSLYHADSSKQRPLFSQSQALDENLFCRASSDPDAGDQVNWDKDFVVGSVVDASVHEQKDYGLVFDFAAHADVLGLAAKHQVSMFVFAHPPIHPPTHLPTCSPASCSLTHPPTHPPWYRQTRQQRPRNANYKAAVIFPVQTNCYTASHAFSPD